MTVPMPLPWPLPLPGQARFHKRRQVHIVGNPSFAASGLTMVGLDNVFAPAVVGWEMLGFGVVVDHEKSADIVESTPWWRPLAQSDKTERDFEDFRN